MSPRIFGLDDRSHKNTIAKHGSIDGPQATTIVLSGAVGGKSRCDNELEDVLAVQQALNRFSADDGGPMTRLKEDGKIGPRTVDAIVRFQDKWSIKIQNGDKVVDVEDGVVDVDGPTLRRLSAGPGQQFSAVEEFDRSKAELAKIFPKALADITALLGYYTALGPNDPDDLLLSAAPLQLAFERNFHGTRSKARKALVKAVHTKITLIVKQFTLMQAKPGTMLANDFAFDRMHAIAFSWPGGFAKFGPDPPAFAAYDMHRIYFCPTCRALDDIGMAYAIVHELGHYCDFQSDDYSYFARDPVGYSRLSPELAVHNADSYAQFCFDCHGLIEFNADEHIVY